MPNRETAKAGAFPARGLRIRENTQYQFPAGISKIVAFPFRLT
jgi:hypothetical protein